MWEGRRGGVSGTSLQDKGPMLALHTLQQVTSDKQQDFFSRRSLLLEPGGQWSDEVTGSESPLRTGHRHIFCERKEDNSEEQLPVIMIFHHTLLCADFYNC